ncbi:MAG: glycerol-3-phosphate dehydrogenase [Stappiaceae bacterium]
MPEQKQTYDLLIVGGGINGVGIARDAAGRGLSVALCEKDDLAQGTSSRSGKLIHGGLRYLEYYEFRLVREALIEREVLLKSAPHIIWPLRFVLPHSPTDRPAWLIRLGLFLYDHLGGRETLPGTRAINLQEDPVGLPIRQQYKKAFEYSDCWVDDARLVVVNAVAAKELGAEIFTRTQCTSAYRKGQHWVAELDDNATGRRKTIHARAIVNAAGPWVNDVVNSVMKQNATRSVRLVKGSHIVTKKFWKGDHAYLVQNQDKRVIFINPYLDGLALIGTTDVAFDGEAETVEADEAEISYLIAAVNRYFEPELSRADVLHHFSGVRPLLDDDADNPSAVTRDYLFEMDGEHNQPPLLSVYGGKITTFRKLAEHALEKLVPSFPDAGPSWTQSSTLPGGDIRGGSFDEFVKILETDFPFLPPSLLNHYGRLYGARSETILNGAKKIGDLGHQFSEHLFEAEIRYLVDHEWARSAEDIVERRTKHFLTLTEKQRADFEAWFSANFAKEAVH